MSVPGPTSPATAPESGGSGALKLVGSAAVVFGVLALAVTLAGQVMPKNGPVLAAGRPPSAEPLVAAKVVTHEVSYELLGEHGVRNVTYIAQGAVIAQERQAATPWSKSIQRTGTEGGNEFYSVSAQSLGHGTLRCRIVVDGRVVAENSVSGDQSTVTCAR